MSHTSKYKMKVKSISTFKKVLDSKGIKYKENVKTQLFSDTINAAIEFKLEGWKYACALTEDGEILYDHWGSKSNTFQKLGETVRDYNKNVIMSKVYGFASNWWEETTKDGIKLTVEC